MKLDQYDIRSFAERAVSRMNTAYLSDTDKHELVDMLMGVVVENIKANIFSSLIPSDRSILLDMQKSNASSQKRADFIQGKIDMVTMRTIIHNSCSELESRFVGTTL